MDQSRKELLSRTEEGMSRVVRDLIMELPYLGIFMSSINRVITNEVKTTSLKIKGINFEIHVNPEYWDTLNFPQQKGVMLHNVLHIAMFHPTMEGSFYDKKAFNLASDIEVNKYIPEEYLDESWITVDKMNAYLDSKNISTLNPDDGTNEYYDTILEILPEDGNNESEGKSFGPDDHSNWETGDNNDVTTKLIKSQIDYQLKEAAKNCSDKARGYLPESLRDYINDLFKDKPQKFNWKSYFRRFTGCTRDYKTKKTRKKESKRFYGNPGLKIIQRKAIFIALDTSGSVSDEDFQEFMAEVYHAHKTGVEITLCNSDAAVAHVEKYNPRKELSRHGYGGTDFTPAIKYFNKVKDKYSAMIYFTDGYCTPPEINPQKPILWVICSNGVKIEGLPGAQIQLPKE